MYKKKETGFRLTPRFSNLNDNNYYLTKATIIASEIKIQQNIEITAIVSAFKSPEALKFFFRILSINDFISKNTKLVYECIFEMYKQGILINASSITSFSKNKYPIDFELLMVIAQRETEYFGSFKNDIMFLKESSATIRGKMAFMVAFDKAFSDDAKSDIFEQTEELKQTLNSVLMINQPIIESLAEKASRQVGEEQRSRANNETIGVTTSFQSLDYRTGGFGKTDLVILAARPGMGKTAFVLTIVRKYLFGNEKIPFALFSLEMPVIQLVKRMYSQLERVDLGRITAGKLTDEEFKNMIALCNQLPKHGHIIDDIYDLSQIELCCETLVIEQGVRIVFLDYLQLIIGTTGDTVNERVSIVTRRLKLLAKRLNVPIVALSQLSRLGKPKDGKYTVSFVTPDLEDLRDSGSIEQDADVVMFLLRLEYYADKLTLKDDEKGTIKVIYKKVRNGSPFTQGLKWLKDYTLINDDDATLLAIEQKEIIEKELNNNGNDGNREEYIEPTF